MSLFSLLNPANIIPRFPPYPGPYAVGSFELEIPVASLGGMAGVAETVQFRVFYPTEKPVEIPISAQPASSWWGSKCDKKTAAATATAAVDPAQEEKLSEAVNQTTATGGAKPVRWLPEPHQREYLSAYVRFLGASSGFAEIVSYGGRLLHYITLPVTADAPLLPKPLDHRFPTMIFSHGLGGTRLAYSHICGSMASYGIVVVAPEHRDGSAPVSFVKSSSPDSPETEISGSKPESGEPGIDDTANTPPQKDANGRAQVDYITHPHHPSEETAAGRNAQLEIRMHEVSLIYTALCKLDRGILPANSSISTPGEAGKDLLSTFKDRLDIRTPGRLIWAGHSFGASTMFQMIKTVATPPSTNPDFAPLFTPPPSDDDVLPLKAQITADSPLMLLDLWCLPLLGKRTSALFKHPLPQIAADKGRNVLAVMSEEFWKWKENLNGVRRVLSHDPGRKRGTEHHKWFEQWDEHHESLASLESAQLEVGGQIVAPQGVTPTPTRPASVAGREQPRFFYALKSAHLSQSDFGVLFPRAIRKAEEPERILELNVRAAVQWLRDAGYAGVLGGYEGEVGGDEAIFEGEVEGWARIGLEEVEAAVEGTGGSGGGEGLEGEEGIVERVAE
ncbi:uncharacterized protein LAJ45_05049 [Morchella importuna]|uniref:uncharacterized protein n=1 Tax=Morchella importuna TaxID=1174673 RepID=UPI001E8D7EFA|nr:uncharacterized protein LAJ45_05049 [Morchella importuna]KAH8150868.1 hypothetical protein LAJ45_05049 [Morchella importuna]